MKKEIINWIKAISCSIITFLLILFLIYILYKHTFITVIFLIFIATTIIFYLFFEDK